MTNNDEISKFLNKSYSNNPNELNELLDSPALYEF
jgi:hypothetical protein